MLSSHLGIQLAMIFGSEVPNLNQKLFRIASTQDCKGGFEADENSKVSEAIA